MIKLEKLDKYYNKGKSNEVHVINETDLVFDDTGLVCILGESGSGKTTLMNTISGLDDFRSGTIDVDGEVITKFGSAKQEQIRNEKFGYIFQNYYLLMEQTVEYNLMLALSLYDISEEDKEERIDYVLNAVDMSRYKKRLVSQLSGGQQQRVAIARALAKTPKVIFADEPTGNLDESNTLRIMSILKQISKDCLVIVVTHEKSIADFFADRIIKISDGKIIKDMKVSSNSSYEYNDDTNIYLGEFEKNTYDNDNVSVETYSDGNMPQIKFKFIYTNNKLYVYPEGDVVVEMLTEDNEKKVIDSKKPVVELKDVEREYSLDAINTSKIPKLKFKDMWKMAKENLSIMGKKQVFLILSFVIMAVLMVITVQDVLSVTNVEEQTIVATDSHILEIDVEKNSNISNDELDKYFSEAIDVMLKRDDITITPYLQPYIKYEFDSFWQLKAVSQAFANYSVINIDKLSKETLISGTMPEKYNEVVVDKRVLENLLGEESEMSNLISTVEHFLGKELITGADGLTLKITGICDSGENSVYLDKFTLISLSPLLEQMNDIEALKDVSKGEFADLTLEEGEVLLSESVFKEKVEYFLRDKYGRYAGLERELEREFDREIYWMEEALEDAEEGNDYWTDEDIKWLKDEIKNKKQERQDYLEDVLSKSEYDITYDEFLELQKNPEGIEFDFETSFGQTYTAVGFFSDDYGLNIIFPNEAYENICVEVIKEFQKFVVYCDDKEKAKDYLSEGIYADTSEEFKTNVNFIIKDTYSDSMDEYMAAANEKFGGRILVTITIFIVSMVILYFMMKSNAVAKITDISVYRLLGISKKSIIQLFALESFLLTTYTSLIAVILTTVVTKYLGSIPSLGMKVIFPWYAIIGTIAFIYAINVIIGVLPVVRLLKLPPAKLAAKYDI